MELQKPRIIKRVVRPTYAGTMKQHGNDFHTTAYTAYADADAISAVEAEDPLTLKNVTMTGDLHMDTGKVITLEQNVAHPDRYEIRPEATWLGFYDNLYSSYSTIRAYTVAIQAFTTIVGTFYYDLFNNASSFCKFRARAGSTLTECANLQSHATAPYFEISRAGDITMIAAKSVDAYTNAGYIKLRRLSQSAEPTPQTGEILLWRDTDDDKTYLVYEDPDVGGRKIELT